METCQRCARKCNARWRIDSLGAIYRLDTRHPYIAGHYLPVLHAVNPLRAPFLAPWRPSSLLFRSESTILKIHELRAPISCYDDIIHVNIPVPKHVAGPEHMHTFPYETFFPQCTQVTSPRPVHSHADDRGIWGLCRRVQREDDILLSRL